MKFFQKRPVAIVITVLAIVLGIGLGQLRANRAPAPPSTGETALDTSLSTAAYETWIWDEANVLSSSEEKQICLYNANWDLRYTSLLAVAAVKSVDGDIVDYAYELGNEIGLGQGDALLVLDIGGQDAYLATGDDFADYMLSGNYLINRESLVITDLLTGATQTFADINISDADGFFMNDEGTKAVFVKNGKTNANGTVIQTLIFCSVDGTSTVYSEPMLFSEMTDFVWINEATVMSGRAIVADGSQSGSVIYTF